MTHKDRVWERFVDQDFCRQNGTTVSHSLADFIKTNQRYYREVEDYDWVMVADRFRGLEAILHRLREKNVVKLIRQQGVRGKVLDAGCGTGLVLRHLSAKAVGLDINPRNLEKTRQHLQKQKLVLGDIKKMPFRKQSFSAVVCTEVLEHLLEPEKALSEIFRVLKPKGLLIGSVPARHPFWWLRFLSSTHPGEPYHRLYRKKELRRLVSPWGRVLELKRRCWGMNYFFVVRK